MVYEPPGLLSITMGTPICADICWASARISASGAPPQADGLVGIGCHGRQRECRQGGKCQGKQERNVSTHGRPRGRLKGRRTKRFVCKSSCRIQKENYLGLHLSFSFSYDAKRK